MKQLWKYIRPYALFMVLTTLIKLSGAFMELLIPRLMETMLDGKVPAGDRTGIYLYGGLMMLAAAACLAFNIIANRMSAISSGKITLKIRHDLFERLENLSARQMDELTISSAESRLTSDTYNINQFLARIQRMGIRAPMLLLGGTVMMLMMDAPLACVLIALLPIIAIVVYLVTKHSLPLYTKQQSVLDQVVRVVQENITGIRVIKALSKTDYEKKRFFGVNDELTRVDRKAGIVTGITNPASSLTMNIGLTLVVLMGASRVYKGGCQAGVIVAFLQYFVMILNGMMGVTRIFVMYSKAEASAKRVAQVLATEEDLAVLASEDGREENAPHIEFRDVTFSYTGVGENLKDLSFRLEHGQALGIIGATGSGKSTLISLLLRLYDPDAGKILIDGEDIRTLPYDKLRKKFGVVFQNDFLEAGTIAENIDFFRDITEKEIAQAAESAQAGFISDKEGGFAASVAVRGNNLSGGQKQRLLIARALAANPEILILDDASSALDYRTDADLRKALRQNYRDCTTVLVAQRVSSLRHADLILVLSDGRLLGAGSHQELMNTCEEYRQIAEAQMGDRKEAASWQDPV